MKKPIRFGSVCSGIEAASVAFGPLGWEAAWFAEIEPFPCAVLAHHYPTVPNLGDMTTIEARVRASEVEAPDILCGGTPCQAFSVAGKRESLQDARGNLSLSFVELANAIDDVRLRRGESASVVLWENVPGVLSTSDNAFGCFLAGLAGECEPLQPPGGRWSDAGGVLGPRRVVAWRILDAQYFGLAQRRRRVFVVASAREDFDPVAVLLVEKGVCRNPAACGEAGEDVAPGSGVGLAKSLRARSNLAHREDADTLVFGGGNRGEIDVATTRSAKGGTGRMDFESETFVVVTLQASGKAAGSCTQQDAECGMLVTHALTSEGHDASEDGTERGVLSVSCFDPNQITSAANRSTPTPELCHTLPAAANSAVAFIDDYATRGIGSPNQHPVKTDGLSDALDTTGPGAVAFSIAPGACGGDKSGQDDIYIRASDVSRTLDCTGADPSRKQGGTAVLGCMAIRRLTPVECARLQGFPDDYLDIEYRGKPAADGPKYRSLGNSWAVPCVRWIGRRIDEQMRGGR